MSGSRFGLPGIPNIPDQSSSSSDISSANAASTTTFVTALVFNLIVFGAELAIFTLVRPYFPAIYQPRTYVPPEEKRIPSIPRSIFSWPLTVYHADYRAIKDANGLDAYFFVRFLRMIVRILVPIWLISWAVLLPVTSVNTSIPGHSGLDRFILGNIAPNKQSRYAAHLILTWVFTVWVWWNIRREMSHFVTTRQRWLIDPVQAKSAQASTVLITGVPQRYLSESALTKLFSHLPGGVHKVWLNRDLGEMPKLYERRLNACKKLESAETSLISIATKRHHKKMLKNAKRGEVGLDSGIRPLTQRSIDAERADTRTTTGEHVALAEKLVPHEKRPTHRLPPFSFLPFGLPLMGQKVDTIEWARAEIAETSNALRECRRTLAKDVARTSNLEHDAAAAAARREDSGLGLGFGGGGAAEADGFKTSKSDTQTYPPLGSAFVLFKRQIAAHLAAQALTHHQPYRMAHKVVGVAPEDVVWANLNMNPYEAKIRVAISWGITIGLIVLWAFPVAFVGAVSNVHSLCTTYKWLAWICKLPPTVLGIISGILPPVALAVLMMLLPIVLRLLARMEGVTQRTQIELSLMTRFFLFQVLHSFLIVTLSSGIIASLPLLANNPGSIPTLLAQNLPKASNFFLTYIILQGLTGTASGFLQVVPLILYYVKLFILGSTPRSIYEIKYGLRSVAWGTLFPVTTLLVVITLAYSIISPIINGLACATFFLFYQLWKYLFLWQLDQPRSGETGGLFFPKAIQHVFVGMYIQQICLAALFFLAQDDQKRQSAVPEGALMIVLIACTVFFQLIINNSYGPLIHALPLSLADQTHGFDTNQQAAARQLEDLEVREDKPEGGSSSKEEGSRSPVDADVERQEQEIKGVDEDAGPKEFYHPASAEPQLVVWLPRDTLGLAEAEQKACRELGVEVSLRGADMDGKGQVGVRGAPPNEVKAL